MDCDGVLTDGGITLLPDGDEQKTFHVRDGQGIVLLHRVGIRTGIISGRRSSLVERRALELGMEFVRQGIEDKVKECDEIAGDAGIALSEIAYIGDDLGDISLLLRVELPIAVADAVSEVKAASRLTTKLKGGRGAVREVAEFILKSQQKWAIVSEKYCA